MNLFRRMPAEPGSLTAALLALLEHCDRALLNTFLRRAGIAAQLEAGAEVSIQFPAPGGPPTAGLAESPRLRLTVITQAPGERWDPQAAAGLIGTILAVTPAGRAPAGGHGLSWEQVDRWLAVSAEQYDPETRTGFLVRQFRAYLAEMGIAYFPGFAGEQLEGAPAALSALTGFYQTADRFFERFGPALAAIREGAAQVRQSRPEDLLAGYCYRDYGGAPSGTAGFLRLALHLPQRELQLSFWLVPGVATDGHARLRQALTEEPGFPGALRKLEQDPLLWLWSAGGERKIPLEEFRPSDLADLNWAQYQAGIQRHLPFDSLAGEGLVERVTGLAEELLETLSPVLTFQLH